MAEAFNSANFGGANGSSTDSTVVGRPSALMGLFASTDGADASVLPITITIYDEAVAADIGVGSRQLFKTTLIAAAPSVLVNLAAKATKGLCATVSDCGTNDVVCGLYYD